MQRTGTQEALPNWIATELTRAYTSQKGKKKNVDLFQELETEKVNIQGESIVSSYFFLSPEKDGQEMSFTLTTVSVFTGFCRSKYPKLFTTRDATEYTVHFSVPKLTL